jgi:hypothetical protein
MCCSLFASKPVGWYLLLPQIANGEEVRRGGPILESSARLDRWSLRQSFDSAADCETARGKARASIKPMATKFKKPTPAYGPPLGFLAGNMKKGARSVNNRSNKQWVPGRVAVDQLLQFGRELVSREAIAEVHVHVVFGQILWQQDGALAVRLQIAKNSSQWMV